jgi:hypothetical protein
MASDDLTVRYNQLMWEMDRLRNEVLKANKDYIEKLKDLRKEMARVNSQLEWVGQRMGPRTMSEVNTTPVQRDAGFQFHPPAA